MCRQVWPRFLLLVSKPNDVVMYLDAICFPFLTRNTFREQNFCGCITHQSLEVLMRHSVLERLPWLPLNFMQIVVECPQMLNAPVA